MATDESAATTGQTASRRRRVARQPLIALLRRQRLPVGLGAARATTARDALADPRDERPLVELARPALNLVEMHAQCREVRVDVVMDAEMRDREAARAPCLEHVERRAPRVQVDVRRRRRREHRTGADPYAGDVAGERAPARLV